MKSQRIMVALLAVSALGLASATVAVAQEAEAGNSGRQAAEGSDGVRQRRSERRQSAGEEGGSQRRERRQTREVAGDGGADTGRRADRRQSRADRRDENDNRRNDNRNRPDERANRQGRHDRRQAWAWRSESGRNARWLDHRGNREFNRRDFGRGRGDHRRAAHTDRRYGDHGRRKDRAFDQRVDRRLSKQRARTRAGWKDGQLTGPELKRIRRDQHRIARMDRRFGSDGRYTKRERRKLNNALDRASNRIYRAKNNRRVAGESRYRKHRR